MLWCSTRHVKYWIDITYWVPLGVPFSYYCGSNCKELPAWITMVLPRMDLSPVSEIMESVMSILATPSTSAKTLPRSPACLLPEASVGAPWELPSVEFLGRVTDNAMTQGCRKKMVVERPGASPFLEQQKERHFNKRKIKFHNKQKWFVGNKNSR